MYCSWFSFFLPRMMILGASKERKKLTDSMDKIIFGLRFGAFGVFNCSPTTSEKPKGLDFSLAQDLCW